ncbi:hypothetical protein BV22DRAFT_343645 [Leucogyrophana mollusca]|uniref:Uncharacterized protein n=1 Tax=Leucogyrophana mollusca TaxID=85980 RepID=A0ACB8BNZ7_9AGAM|nr:hypothetical protein BV22DRAFT_343645 [Leucogyrophana mollusca]
MFYVQISRLLRMTDEDVQRERKRRLRAEQLLREVERECRAPFVVPVLLQAFLSITELTE